MTQVKVILFSIFILQGLLMSATLKHIPYKEKQIATIFEKHKSLPIFNLQLVFANGGYIGDKDLPGITNLVAQLLNEGTKKDGAVGYARKLENNAISIHTNTGFETFVIEISCLTSEKDLALKLLQDLLKDPNITQESLKKVKTLTLSKLQQKQNDFDYIASSHLKKLSYKNTPLEYPKLGDVDSIQRITLEDIQTRLDEILNLDNLIIAVGGDIKFQEFQNQATNILEYFHPKGVTHTPKIDMSDKVQYEEIIKDTCKQTEQSHLYMLLKPFILTQIPLIVIKQSKN